MDAIGTFACCWKMLCQRSFNYIYNCENNVAMKTATEKLWTIEDVAEFCQVKVSVVKYWLYHADLPHIKLGKQIRFDSEDVKDWVEIQKVGFNLNNGGLKTVN